MKANNTISKLDPRSQWIHTHLVCTILINRYDTGANIENSLSGKNWLCLGPILFDLNLNPSFSKSVKFQNELFMLFLWIGKVKGLRANISC